MIVSLVLPVRNGEWCLPYSLESLLSQTRQPDEILICIGKCTDNTEKIVLDFQKRCPVPTVILYDREGIGTGYAMKILTERAMGDVVLWIDADHIKPKDWVYQIVKYFEDDPDLVYLRERGEENSSSSMSYFKPPETEYIRSITYDTKHYISPSGMMAFKRDNVINVGNFDPLFVRGQDLDMTVRLIFSNSKGGVCTPYGHHFGVNGQKNMWKPLKTPTFFKFIYKYGWRYCFIDRYGFFALLLRSTFIFSTLSLIFSIILKNPPIFLLSILGLFTFITGFFLGFKIEKRKLTFNILLVQILSGVGEYYQIYCLLTKEDKPRLGYGVKWIK